MKPWTIFGIVITVVIMLLIIGSIWTTRVFWLFTIMYFIGCYYTVIALFGAFWDTKPPLPNPGYKPFISVLIPMKNEEKVISNTLMDLRQQFYHLNGRSRMEIIAIDDRSTDNTAKVVRNLVSKWGNGTKHKLRLVRNLGKNHGKPAALNSALKHAKGDIICVFDADARVPPDFMEKAIPYFMDDKVGGVQGKVRIFNRLDNTLTEIQDDEFASFNRAVQRSRDAIGGAVALGGNGQFTRKSILDELGGWTEESITEDLELSVRFYEKGWKIRYAEGSTVYQEAVSSVSALFKQRTRWSQGHILTFLHLAPRVLMSPMIPPMKKLDLLIYLTGIMTPGFVFLSYFFGGMAFLSSITVSSGVNDLLWIWASIAFIPVIYWGLWSEVSKNPLDLIFRSFRIFMFCFHWIPTFFYGWYKALESGFRDGHPRWEKTRHKVTTFNFEIF
ncbi:MAG: glycosyltransferase family 2 protein [Candidatus Thermoplasmatota archaeon]|nr:glycosyltransferase family 2 protein [Candidatus Thermoplasmatota archaeon]